EYIELTNTSDKAIDLSGVQITNGVDAVIDDTIKATLAPGAYAVIVSDREAFEKRYPDVDPKLIVSEFANSSNLDNNGERLTLRDRTGLLLHTLRYNDKAPWPTWENNEGRSLTFIGEVSPSIAHPEN
ncbi:MAG: lamin tail domain-containing protein, partial [Verrucomicrobiales bacterium]